MTLTFSFPRGWSSGVPIQETFSGRTYLYIQQNLNCWNTNGSLTVVNLKSRVSIAQDIYMSRDMRFPTMWYVRPAKPQISLRIRAI